MSIGQGRVLGAQMEVAVAFEAIRRAQKESDREKRTNVPSIVFDRLRAQRDVALGNLEQAHAAAEAAKRFPPIKR